MNTVSFIHTHTVLKPGVKIFNYFLPMQWMTVGSNSKTGLHWSLPFGQKQIYF